MDLNRVLVWFSCGAASAVAAKLASEKYTDGRLEILYCDTLAYEHPDNPRFMEDVERWTGHKIKVLKSKKYADIFDVFNRERWLVGPGGAKCTTEMKKVVRKDYQRPDDLHIFGLTADEENRIRRFASDNHDVMLEWNLRDAWITKEECYRRISAAGIELPAMYKLGYNNNNCIGCVKGGAGYWNKIRRDFPESFVRMAEMERKLDAAINFRRDENGTRIRIFLDELPKNMGTDEPEQDMDCGPQCRWDFAP